MASVTASSVKFSSVSCLIKQNQVNLPEGFAYVEFKNRAGS